MVKNGIKAERHKYGFSLRLTCKNCKIFSRFKFSCCSPLPQTPNYMLSQLVARTWVKLARPVPVDQNKPDVIGKRYENANWFTAEGVINNCVFTVECGYNIWSSRSCGRARLGKQTYRQVAGQQDRNVTIVLDLSATHGLDYHTAQIGRMKRPCFNDFFWSKLLNVLTKTIKHF